MKSESATSPSLMTTVFLGYVRMTPVAAICRKVSGASGASGSAEGAVLGMGATFAGRRILTRVAPRRSARRDRPFSGVFPDVLDDFAVVRQLARPVERNVAPQLRHIADRGDDRFYRQRPT